jgi:signal transduction histidine kinase
MTQLFEPFRYFFQTGLFRWLTNLADVTGGPAALLSLVVAFICLEIAVVFVAFYVRAGRRLDIVFAAQAVFGSLLNLVSWAIFSTDSEIHKLEAAHEAIGREILESSAFWVRMQFALAFVVLCATVRFIDEALQRRLPHRLLQSVYLSCPLCALLCFSTLFQVAQPELKPFYALNEGTTINLPAEAEGALFYPLIVAMFGSWYALLGYILYALSKNTAQPEERHAYHHRSKAIALGLFVMCGLSSVDVVFAVKRWTLTTLPHLYTFGWGLFCFIAAGALFKEMVHEHELRRRVRQAQEQTEQSIAGGMAHEIKNALGGSVLVLSDLMDRALISQSQNGLTNLTQILERHQRSLGNDFQHATRQIVSAQEVLQELERALLLILSDAQRGINVTNLVLEIARIDSRITHQPVDLNDIVKQLIYREAQGLPDIAFHFEPVNAAVACGNPYLFRSVAQNLLANAIDALKTKRDGTAKAVFIRTGTEEREGKRYGLLEIQDNGIGIKPEQLHRIFDPFFSTKGLRGTGLGLNLVKRIVERYGGEIEVNSQDGVGSLFRVRLPESHTEECARQQVSVTSLGSRSEV